MKKNENSEFKIGNPSWTLKLVRENHPKYVITSSSDVFNDVVKKYIFKELVDSNIEKFYFVGLATNNQIVLIDRFTGGVNESRVYISEVAKRLLLTNCTQVIFVHNHPSGNLKASESDISITNKLKEALGLFEIRVLDHLIVGYEIDDYVSFKEHGYLQKKLEEFMRKFKNESTYEMSVVFKTIVNKLHDVNHPNRISAAIKIAIFIGYRPFIYESEIDDLVMMM